MDMNMKIMNDIVSSWMKSNVNFDSISRLGWTIGYVLDSVHEEGGYRK